MPGTTAAAAAAPPEPHPLPAFALERFFARWEFAVQHSLCSSDSEPLSMAELLDLADDDARQRWGALRLAYTETQGLPALREAVASTLFTSIAPHQLAIAAPQEALYLTMQALLRPGDRVVCTFPGYQSLYEVARSLGCAVDLWQLRSSAGSGQLAFSVEDAERLITPGTRLVVVNSPHNPSGAQFSPADWRRLVQLCEGAGAYLFRRGCCGCCACDEMYRGLELDPAARLPAAADAYERGISLGGCSKATGGPGLRIGWVATKDAPLLARVLELKDYTSICSSAPSEVLALVMLRNWAALVERSLAVVRCNLDTLDAFFARWAHVFEWRRPAAGSVAFPRLLTGEAIEAWCEQLAEQAGVLLLPASVYGHAGFTAEGRFRLGLGRRDLPQGLERLEAWLAARYPRAGS